MRVPTSRSGTAAVTQGTVRQAQTRNPRIAQIESLRL
jgi:hypothetical protein